MSEQNSLKIILVHGGGHGAWCWYKVVAILRSQGYSVTAVDLAACGSDPRRMPEDVSTFDEYAQPLMDLMASVAEGEKVVLVGHSFGGFSLGKAMDTFPEKIAVAVFVSAIMPDTIHSPFYLFEQVADPTKWDKNLMLLLLYYELTCIECLFKQHLGQLVDKHPEIEAKSIEIPGRSEPFITMTSQPKLLANNLYQNCSFEDLTLATLMVRPTLIFQEDLSNKAPFSEERYGSVDKVFIICGEDAMLTVEFQRLFIQNSAVKEVMEIEGADHMAMLSKPKELCQCLTTIVSNYVK